MPRNRDEPPAVRVYTVCDESRYLIVRNVPALGCGDELLKLFGSYGEVEECKPMDAEDCEQFTDVYWIKFSQASNARFAKRKLDESVFLGNKLNVSYAPEFESVQDTKEKLEGRRKEVLGRIKFLAAGESGVNSQVSNKPQSWVAQASSVSNRAKQQINQRDNAMGWYSHGDPVISHISSNEEYFPSPSMNVTVRLVRGKLDKIQSSGENRIDAPAAKKTKVDNRRRI